MKNSCVVAAMACLLSPYVAFAQEEYPTPPEMKPEMSEFWTPQPQIITPGSVQKNGIVSAPSDAIVLFDGSNLNKWQKVGGGVAGWRVNGDYMEVVGGKGDIETKDAFEDFQLHIEWATPEKVVGNSQGRGNSGVFMQGVYELQVLDSYDNKTYANGQAGSIYKQTPPLVNAMNKPGVWNSYDVIYTAPRFKADGSVFSPARITVLHNGVLIQNNTTILGDTPYIGFPKYNAHGRGPIKLQDHGNPTRFRNIWIREL